MAASKSKNGQPGKIAGPQNSPPKKESADLLRELETLQQVLDDAAGDHIEHGSVPVLDPKADEIPVLDDLFTQDDIPVLKPVKNTPAPETVASRPAAQDEPANTIAPDKVADAIARAMPQNTPQAPLDDLFGDMDIIGAEEDVPAPAVAQPATRVSANPFLPQAVLDRLQTERAAAQQSAEEAHRTMQRVQDRKQEDAKAALSNIGRQLTAEQKTALIDQLVEEMLPQLAERLKDKLRQSLK